MRITCPCCQKRFDVAHAAVLKEAARLKAVRESGDSHADATDCDGNRLNPADETAKRLREQAIARRLAGKHPPR